MEKPIISVFIDEKAREILSRYPEKTFIDLPVLDLDMQSFRIDGQQIHIYIRGRAEDD